MERMLSAMAEHPLAAGAGLLAMLCYATWPVFKARWAMLATYVGNNLAFVLHYALLGHGTAAAMNGLMAVQTLVAIGLLRWPNLRWIYFALFPALAAASLMTWQGPASVMSAAATILSTMGRMQKSEIALRAMLLASTPFWLAHDIIVGSLPGLVADILSMTIGAVMLVRTPAVRSYLSSEWRMVPSGQ